MSQQSNSTGPSAPDQNAPPEENQQQPVATTEQGREITPQFLENLRLFVQTQAIRLNLTQWNAALNSFNNEREWGLDYPDIDSSDYLDRQTPPSGRW